MSPKTLYNYAIDPTGDSTANKVLRLIGTDKTVLELGCGPGPMTQFMQQHNNCRVTAIEFDAALAELAKPFCQRLLIADLDTLDFSVAFSEQERFDVVVAADVLEHLKDPWHCLRAVRRLLNPAGYLVVSIPNVGHNVILAQLMAGRFPYQDKGLLDRTHLRFFTRYDITDLLLNSGFMPAVWEYNRSLEQDTEFARAWLQALPEVRELITSTQREDGQIYQFIVKAFPSTESGWIAQTRIELEQLNAEHQQLSAEHQKLKQHLAETTANLAEHQKAFGEARGLLDDKECALSEYSKAFHEAREQLEQRSAQLDEVNQAFNEACVTIEQFQHNEKKLQQALLDQRLRARLKRRWRRLLGQRSE